MSVCRIQTLLSETAKPSNASPSDALSYLEFQTGLIKMFQDAVLHRLSAKHAFVLFFDSETYFPSQMGSTQIVVDWPYKDTTRCLHLEPRYSESDTDTAYELDFLDETVFLTLRLKVNKQLEVIKPADAKNSIWKSKEIDELVQTINTVLRVPKIIFLNAENKALVKNIKKQSCHFNQDIFRQWINQHRYYNMGYRINNIILYNAQRSISTFKFYINWKNEKSQAVSLKAVFSLADTFKLSTETESGYSWVLTEKKLLSAFSDYATYQIPSGQLFYSLKVSELVPKTADIQSQEVDVLDFWLTNDGKMGELHNVHSGKSLSGNDVLKIYSYFDHLFRVKKTFICDASKLMKQGSNSIVPLRLILPLIYDKTWYQSKLENVSLFECKNFKTAYDGNLTQNAQKNKNVLTELQNITLDNLYDVLLPNDQKRLLKLYRNNFSCSILKLNRLPFFGSALGYFSGHPDITLKDLTTVIYETSKSNRMVTNDLDQLAKLLCTGTNLFQDEDEKSLDRHAKDYWLKSRVWKMLWEGYFWVKDEVKINSRLSP